MSKLSVIIIMLTCACGSSKENIIIKNGVSYYDIKCLSIGNCLEQASNYCPHGFTLIAHSGTKSAPHINQWSASPDGSLHLLTSCK